MKIALLSDVHGNPVALDAVLEDLARQGGADRHWFLGDVTGYGPWPRQCLMTLHEVVEADSLWLAGNHDLAIPLFLRGGVLGDEDLTALVGNHGYDKVDQQHAIELVDFVRMPAYEGAYERMINAPTWAIPIPGIATAHGNVIAPPGDRSNVVGSTSYIEGVERAEMALSLLLAQPGAHACQVLCVGHTHVQRLFYSSSGCPPYAWSNLLEHAPGGPAEPAGVTFDLAPGGVFVLCGGSIGQPRGADKDHPDPRAGYAILTLADGRISVEFRRVPYGFAAVQAKMEAEGYPTPLIYRLAIGM